MHQTFKFVFEFLKHFETMILMVLSCLAMAEDCYFCSFIHVDVRVCNLHNPYRIAHMENYKQHTAYLQMAVLFPPHLALF